MGSVDIEGKKYLSDPVIFADAFNYLLYDGAQVIKPDELRELDTAGLTVPCGRGARAPVQKYRDLLKLWNAMTDDTAIYVILGAELQDQIHYGMPVKDGLYDMLGYSKQIAEIKRSYKNSTTPDDEGELTVEEDVLKIKLTSAEFLSGLRKGDRLIPIITAVVYLGEEPWDGPRSLYDMLDIRDEILKKFIPNYWINLISPADMGEEEFKKFHTELGFAMRIIKHQAHVDEMIEREGDKTISQETAFFLNATARLGLEFEENTGGVSMNKAMERKYLEKEVTGAIAGMRLMGASESEIIAKITESFQVSEDYVLALMDSQVA